MAQFQPSKKLKTDFNNGNEYLAGDGLQAETVNNLVESQLWTQALGTNAPNTTDISATGTPSVSIEQTADGTPRLKFLSLKGASGAKLVSQTLTGQDANGGNIYLQTFDDGTTATFVAPKGVDGTDGQDGVGISSITTTTTTTSGEANTVKITLTDGTVKTFYVYNGAKGDTGSGVTGVKGNAESSYRTGNVNITPANIGLKFNLLLSGNFTKKVSGYDFSGNTVGNIGTWMSNYDFLLLVVSLNNAYATAIVCRNSAGWCNGTAYCQSPWATNANTEYYGNIEINENGVVSINQMGEVSAGTYYEKINNSAWALKQIYGVKIV